VGSSKINVVKSKAEHKVCGSNKQEVRTPWNGSKILVANMPVELKSLFREK
jgi:hypothetical protein